MSRAGTWAPEDVARLESLWETEGGRVSRIAQIMGKTKGQISGKSRILSLHFSGGRSRTVDLNHPASRLAHTVFPSRVRPIGDVPVLKDGDSQRKLGPLVRKGPWKGMAIYSLTLEERATCPRTCLQWRNCYGNTMGLARRFAHGPALEERIIEELAMLQRRHRKKGFVVRLHILGDFYSLRYLSLWHHALAAFPALHIFGYTAHQPGTAIGDAIVQMRNAQWHRFAVRTSGGPPGQPSAIVVDKHADKNRGEIICPAQTGKTKNCGSCGLCWSPAARDKAILFLEH